MTLDRHAADRRRFARLLGVDGRLGSGLPIGAESRRGAADRRTGHDRSRHQREHEQRSDRDAPESDRTPTAAAPESDRG